MADESGLFAAETTVLGVGNVILRDEGFGVRVAEYLAAHYDFPESVQIVDGGTLGIELTQFVTGTRRLLVIDSINGHAAPGTLFRFEDDAVMEHFQDKISAHEVGIQDVLALLAVTGKKIPEVVVIGAANHAEIWDAARWEAYSGAITDDRIAAAMEDIGF